MQKSQFKSRHCAPCPARTRKGTAAQGSLNYFDSSLPFQLSFLNHRSRPGSRYSVNIPMQDDDYNSVRCEYVEMLENQIAKSNNGIVRTKLLTFGVNVDDLSTARARLERVEADICGNFKKLGVKCRSLSGLERLELLHGQLHPGSGSPLSLIHISCMEDNCLWQKTKQRFM